MFRKRLETLFDQQKTRLHVASNDKERVDIAFADLEASEYSITKIDTRCAAELKVILSKRYEHTINSSRLNGFGWTRGHIEDHMKRFLNQQLQEAGTVLKVSLESYPKP